MTIRKNVNFTARGMAFRGFWASPTVTPTSSAPRKEKTALVRQLQKARNLPVDPSVFTSRC